MYIIYLYICYCSKGYVVLERKFPKFLIISTFYTMRQSMGWEGELVSEWCGVICSKLHFTNEGARERGRQLRQILNAIRRKGKRTEEGWLRIVADHVRKIEGMEGKRGVNKYVIAIEGEPQLLSTRMDAKRAKFLIDIVIDQCNLVRLM